MKHITSLSAVVVIALLSVVAAHAQTGSNATKHYEKDELAFDYPQGWDLTDNSSQEGRTVTLERKGSLAKIAVNINDPTSTCDFQAQSKKIADRLTANVANQIHAGAGPTKAMPVTTEFGGSSVEGAQLKGVLNGKPVTAAVYSSRLNRRYVSLVYILGPNDERAKAAWNAVRTTLKVMPRVTVLSFEAGDKSEASISSGVLNGRALVLPKPVYSKVARAARAAGTVRVQVIIDEKGSVISAHAVDGHPLLQAACVEAANRAKFSLTKLCGEPVRVTGVITYNFVAL